MIKLTPADPLKKQLEKMHRDGEEREAERVAKKAGVPYTDLRKVPVALEAVKLIPEATAKEAEVAAIELKIHDVALAARNPLSPKVEEITKDLEAKKYTVKLFAASLSSLAQAWRLYSFVSEEAEEITGKVVLNRERFHALFVRLTTFQLVEHEVQQFDFTKLETSHLLEVILAGALGNGASDVHLEAEEKQGRIRYRIDGLLHDISDAIPLRHYAAVVSRIKLLSGMKINVGGEAQDGRFTVGLPKKDVEMRVSMIPSEFGETVVMRILDPDSINVSLPDLGLREDDLALVEAQLKKPNGLILNTGPTGSGKTTTLYTFLKYLNSSELKIITVEDPIEYRIQGLEQTQVDAESNYTFAAGLRAIVRQDPDVILVGEIRDLETADIAMQAALTGHLVFSTLHTNNAIGAVPRLVNIGAKPETIGPALALTIGQRLVRRLCGDCKKPATVSSKTKEGIKKFLEGLPARVDRSKYDAYTIYEPGGCEKCNHFGYKGRCGVFEFFEATKEFEEEILKQVSEPSLMALAEKQQMVTMQEDAILKTLLGMTTFEEVEEITGPIPWRAEEVKKEVAGKKKKGEVVKTTSKAAEESSPVKSGGQNPKN